MFNTSYGHRLFGSLILLIAASTLVGCATSRVAPGTALADMPLENKTSIEGLTAFQLTAYVFGRDLQASFRASKDIGLAQQAFRSGLTMIDLQCNRYLDVIGSANQVASNERRQVGLIGGFASAIMGLAGSSAKEIAGVATAFSFSGSSMDSFTTAFLFSDAASSITKIVRESQQAWLDSVATPNNLAHMNYADALRLLGSYEEICRPSQIRALIDQAISKGKVVAERGKTSDTDVGVVLQALNAAIGIPVSETQAIVLYAWFTNPTQRTSGANLSKVEPTASLLANRSVQALERQLAQAFLPISLAGASVPERWGPGVQVLLQPYAPTSSVERTAAPSMTPVFQRPSVPVLSIH